MFRAADPRLWGYQWQIRSTLMTHTAASFADVFEFTGESNEIIKDGIE